MVKWSPANNCNLAYFTMQRWKYLNKMVINRISSMYAHRILVTLMTSVLTNSSRSLYKKNVEMPTIITYPTP